MKFTPSLTCIPIKVFDEATHAYVGQFGARGDGPGQLQNPNNIAVDDSLVYVTDGSNHRICVRFRAFILQWVDGCSCDGWTGTREDMFGCGIG